MVTDTRFRPFRYIYPSLIVVPGSTDTLTVGLVAGSNVSDIIRDCRYLAELESDKQRKTIRIEFTWCGIRVCVDPSTNPRSLYADYQKVVSGEYSFKSIGPRATSR